VAPNYPLFAPATFDALAVNVKSFLGAPVVLPAGLELVVELVRNGTIPTGLEVRYPAGTAFPLAVTSGGIQGVDSGLVTISPDDTYDLRVSLDNVSGAELTVNVDISVEISATLRAVDV
jgi:hypothetical protein